MRPKYTPESPQLEFNFDEPPYGYCACGCGKPVPQSSNPRRQARYINGHTSRSSTSIEQRFWRKVDKRGPNECWNWQGSKKPWGHGTFAPKMHVFMSAHRYSYELHVAPIPEGLQVNHARDNGACVNPAHLWIGTQRENVHDMISKGREDYTKCVRGEKNPATKLTVSKVLEIRELCAASVPHRVIAERFEICTASVSNIFTRKTWKHIK